MNRSNIKFLIPNGITFLSLIGGLSSIIATIEGNLLVAATLIFVSYWLDMIDGFLARKLNAQSEFGLHLDSLVDMVSLGVAPGVLVYQHLRIQGTPLVLLVPPVLLLVLAGAFRLARFNLLPPKTSKSRDSVGLTITQAGGTLSLAVLADVAQPFRFLTAPIYLFLLILLAGLMVSTIPFPPSNWFFGGNKWGRVFLILLLLLIAILPTFSTWFVFYLMYILVAAVRAFLFRIKPSYST